MIWSTKLEGLIVSKLKLANKYCAPPLASKTRSRLVIAIRLKLANKCCAPPLASKRVRVLSNRLGFSAVFRRQKKSPASAMRGIVFGGEGGIRTLDTLLTYTPLAGARLQPLGHFSINFDSLFNFLQKQLCRPEFSGGIIAHRGKNQRLLSEESSLGADSAPPFSIWIR